MAMRGRRTLGWVTAFLLCAGGALTGEDNAGADSATAFPLGAWTLVALSDAHNTGRIQLLRNIPQDVAEALLPDGTFPLDVNAFLVRTGERNIIIDTGLGVQHGTALARLAETGLTPEQIDLVILTHLHGDHIGGLLTDGQPTFANADVYVAAEEKAYWFSDEERKKAVAVLEPYGDRLTTFGANEEIIPGITVFSAFGHTPGHSGFLLAPEGGDALLVWGDLLHCQPVQFKHPDAAMVFDVDPEKAAETRRAVLQRVVDEGWPVAGMHLPFPGVGRVTPDGDGFAYTPGLK